MIGSAPVEENLPSAPAAAVESMPDSTERTTPVTASDPEPGRLLIVDDDQSACEFLESILRRQYKVTWRTSAHDALEMVADQDFDVILTDLNMTDIGGLDLCERIVGIRPDIPVIVVTGYGSMEAAIGAIRAGAYDFVTKPVDATVIELTVDRALRHRRLQEEVKRLRKAAASPQGFDAIIGRSPAMRRARPSARSARNARRATPTRRRRAPRAIRAAWISTSRTSRRPPPCRRPRPRSPTAANASRRLPCRLFSAEKPRNLPRVLLPAARSRRE